MNYVLYSGYANSGGTIIGLLFEEMERAVVLPMEFRLLKERFGLCELEDALFKSMDPEIIDLALKDFQWLCKQYATSIGRFNRAGYSYEQRSGNTFGNATDQYINSLIDFKYPKSWHYYESRDQWLYSAFLKFQPDLNWRNPEVKEAMWENVLLFCLQLKSGGKKEDLTQCHVQCHNFF